MNARPFVVSLAVAGLALAAFVAQGEEPFFEVVTIGSASAEQAERNSYPTIDRLSDGVLCCVWTETGGAVEKARVVGAYSPDNGKTWQEPEVLIDSELYDYDPSTIVYDNRLIVTSTSRPANLSYSKTYAVRSEDSGRTWGELYEIPMNHRYTCGKIHIAVRTQNDWLLTPYSWDRILETGEDLEGEGQMDLAVGVMISKDGGLSWMNSEDAYAKTKINPGGAIEGVDEPAIVELEDGTLYMLLRTGDTRLWETRSEDHGQTWSEPQPSPLTGHNAPAALYRLDDAQAIVAVWNNSPTSRNPLCASLSTDGCRTWSEPRIIAQTDGPQVSYPGCIQAADGTIVAVWQQDHAEGRDVKAARFNRAWLLAGE